MIDAEILNILKRCEVDGNKIKITDDNLDRDIYLKVNTVLERLRGEWNRSKQFHVFPYDVSEIFNSVLESGIMPPDNPESYYFTPDIVVDEILEFLNLPNHKDWNILEPSAGTGHIARKIKERVPESTLYLVEWLDLNVKLLQKQGFKVWHGDFLEYESDVKFDSIVMNPPFTVPGNRLAYIDHIYHAFELLKPERKMAVIVPKGWTYRSDKKNVEFRNFVWKYLDAGWELESGTFEEAGTNVATIVLILEKSDWKLEPKQGFPSWNAWNLELFLYNDRKTVDELEGSINSQETFNRFLDRLVNRINLNHLEGIVLSDQDKIALWEHVTGKD